MIEIEYEILDKSDLIVNAVYKGGVTKTLSDEPISKIMKVGNQSGFRRKGSIKNGKIEEVQYVVLFSTRNEKEWPNVINEEEGKFYYYGDNRKENNPLLETKQKGNLVLNKAFEALEKGERKKIPPFFLFEKGNEGRDVIFKGVAVPGIENETNNLKIVNSNNCENYLAAFTILNEYICKREWIEDLINGTEESNYEPIEYKKWKENAEYRGINYKKIEQKLEETETMREVKIRKKQAKLRKEILINYEGQCALCDINKEDLLICSHIAPWAHDEENRLNTKNSILLCSLHDRLFDKGYFTLDENYNIIYGKKTDKIIKTKLEELVFRKPKKDEPGIEFLRYHKKNILK